MSDGTVMSTDAAGEQVAAESAAKARENARAVEARRACESSFDPIAAMKAAMSGGGEARTERVFNAEAKPPPTLPERILAAVDRAAAEHRKQVEDDNRISQRSRMEIAADLREMAQRVERGS